MGTNERRKYFTYRTSGDHTGTLFIIGVLLSLICATLEVFYPI